LGFGLPLLALSFLSGAAQRWITRLFARHARLINVVSGLLLVGIAVYDLSLNWELIFTFIWAARYRRFLPAACRGMGFAMPRHVF
jgi:hypothetical protein